jgi:hypothetical protein
MDICAKQEIDLSCEVSSLQYFKSSFARSMAVDCMDQSKSLDNAYLAQPTVGEKRVHHQTESETAWTPSVVSCNRNCKPVAGLATLCKENKLLQNWCDLPYVTPQRKSNKTRSQNIDAAKPWKTQQVTVLISSSHSLHNR